MLTKSLIKNTIIFYFKLNEGTSKKEEFYLKLQPWIGPEHNFHNYINKTHLI